MGIASSIMSGDNEKVLDRIADFIVDVGVGGGSIRDLVKDALMRGVRPYEVFTKGMVKGITIVGEKYESGEYFLTELVGAGEIMKEGMEEISPLLTSKDVRPVGKVVIGTVAGDLHDIGKDIVKMLLSSVGFVVHDLGVDVSAEKFVDEVRRTEADIVAMSALLTTTMNSMKVTIEEVRKAGLRGKVKIIVGGAPITEEFSREIGADAAATDAGHGVRICKAWMQGSA
jgi:5-methyltetrahydrofolate--homocysteine methyltransferase